MNLVLKAYFFCGLLLNCMFVQAVQQSLTFAQPNQIQYKVFPVFNKTYKDVVCVRTQRAPERGDALTGHFLGLYIVDHIGLLEDLSDPQKRMLLRELEGKFDTASPGKYAVTDFVDSYLSRKVCLSEIPHLFFIMPHINDLAQFKAKTLLVSGVGKELVLKHMAAVERMPIKPEKVYFEYLFTSTEGKSQIIKDVDAAKQRHFYAGLCLDKKRREDLRWKNFPRELRDTILAFVGHPYDGLK